MTENKFTPIVGDVNSRWQRPWRKADDLDVVVLDHEDTNVIRDLLLGRKVEKVDNEHLLLDNGTVIKAIGREGGCVCGAGDYWLSELNGVDNVITAVEFDYAPYANGCEGYYRIFVYADNQKINLMQFDGSDGSGYYGTGFEILVREGDISNG
ncbi:DUF7448 domain-containing protein [Dermabacter hominis]|uniref:DUF7448 domain-containing protein n=1 Tax=Dermabacter hominis TaxID=36740 RepID=UPI002A45C982|nr:hypothetical protein [Dermabacter hominis]